MSSIDWEPVEGVCPHCGVDGQVKGCLWFTTDGTWQHQYCCGSCERRWWPEDAGTDEPDDHLGGERVLTVDQLYDRLDAVCKEVPPDLEADGAALVSIVRTAMGAHKAGEIRFLADWVSQWRKAAVIRADAVASGHLGT